ncbi:MAG: hypothetical protein K2N28_06125 [Muribaculaceae bacterium]|nr:hypothetical protein [Muribaculaceae bacterium]
MKTSHSYILLILLFLAPVLLTGCFTGIESTPRITARDVKRQRATVTPEMTYMDSITGSPVADWQPGKRFVVTPGKISFALSPIAVADALQPGDTLYYAGRRAVPSMTGTDDTLLMLTTLAGDTLSYRIATEPAATDTLRSLEIPFLIEGSIIDSADRLLTGNDYYITTPVWFNDADQNITGRKLVKVHITGVTGGNGNYPLAVHFTDDSGMRSKVFMSLGSGARATRNFDTLFSLTDPRRRFKDIKDDVWECITLSTVKKEMTREECRLALGNPREVVHGHYLERWTYDNGVSLIFDDGYLQQIRR